MLATIGPVYREVECVQWTLLLASFGGGGILGKLLNSRIAGSDWLIGT